jgi:hypothetical protein
MKPMWPLIKVQNVACDRQKKWFSAAYGGPHSVQCALSLSSPAGPAWLSSKAVRDLWIL